MFQLNLTDEDQKWLSNKYPGLSVTRENGVKIISGEFDLWASYKEVTLRDSYQIRIELQSSLVSDLPTVIETDGRIKKLAENNNIPINDLHTYDNNQICLCVKPSEATFFPKGFSFQDFIELLVVPFFYAQKYFEEYKIWPWDSYSHGALGWFEWYNDQNELTRKSTECFIENLRNNHVWNVIEKELSKKGGVKGHHICLCGSKKRYRNCHNSVLHGLWKLQKDIKEFGLEV